MTAATITKKPVKVPAPAVAVAPMTLAQATDMAMTELSKAVDLMVSAQRAAEDGHHLDRALRVAEEIALEVMGWMDHGQRGPGEWMDRMFDCQAVLRCAALDPSEPASTLAAAQAADAVDRATAVLDQPFADEKPRAAATVEASAPAEDLDARRRVAFDAHYEMVSLADGAKKLLATECNEDTIKYTGILSRIELLGHIVFHAARLDGSDGTGWGEWDDLDRLKRAFNGGLT